MAVNKNALIRYKTIDKCLTNRFRRWTLDDLIEACSDALYHYEGKDSNVSKRTIQLDIQNMRSDKLGYNAPIVVVERKYYTYEDKSYSITNLPLSEGDLSRLNEAIDFLSQFKGFSHFKELDSMVQKLEDQIYSQKYKRNPIIDFEKNDDLKGLEYLDVLYQAILNKQTLTVTYKSFKARAEGVIQFFPYLLKEYRNRWFVIGKKSGAKGILNLALDRIIHVKPNTELPYRMNADFDSEKYFKNTIGVSVEPNSPGIYTELFITKKHAPYVETKPFHSSQKTISSDYYGIVISLKVHHNFEFEKLILGLADGVKVIKPESLKRKIKTRMAETLDAYSADIRDSNLQTFYNKLTFKGYGQIHQVYTQREVRSFHRFLQSYFENKPLDVKPTCEPMSKQREVNVMLMNKNLNKIFNGLDDGNHEISSIYYKSVKTTQNSKGHWNQLDDDGNYRIFIFLNDSNSDQMGIDVIPGSQQKVLKTDEIEMITENTIPTRPIFQAGGMLIIKKHLLFKFSGKITQKRMSWFEINLKTIEKK